jgi:hypothetical protein
MLRMILCAMYVRRSWGEVNAHLARVAEDRWLVEFLRRWGTVRW